MWMGQCVWINKEIIHNKIFSLQNDVDYSKFIKSHELEKTILELQQKDL